MPSPVLKKFTRYRVVYAITDPNGKDYARIDLFKGTKKIGQILFGSALVPGSHATLLGQEIHLYFPLSHFDAICRILRDEKNLSLCLDDVPATRGGLTTSARPF